MATDFSAAGYADMVARVQSRIEGAFPDTDMCDPPMIHQGMDVSLYYSVGKGLADMLQLAPSWGEFHILMELLTYWADEGRQLALTAPALAGDQGE